jgi:hypothetical protein
MWMDVDAYFNNFDISLDNIIDKFGYNNIEDKYYDLIIAKDLYSIDTNHKNLDAYVNSGILIFKSS